MRLLFMLVVFIIGYYFNYKNTTEVINFLNVCVANHGFSVYRRLMYHR